MIRFLFGLPFSCRQMKFAASRPPLSKGQFVSRISAEAGDERAAAMVWDELLARWVTEGFTPYPDDSLGFTYGIAEEELDEDLVAHVLNELGLPIPDGGFVESFGAIDSPLRLAQLVSAVRAAGH